MTIPTLIAPRYMALARPFVLIAAMEHANPGKINVIAGKTVCQNWNVLMLQIVAMIKNAGVQMGYVGTNLNKCQNHQKPRKNLL